MLSKIFDMNFTDYRYYNIFNYIFNISILFLKNVSKASERSTNPKCARVASAAVIRSKFEISRAGTDIYAGVTFIRRIR